MNSVEPEFSGSPPDCRICMGSSPPPPGCPKREPRSGFSFWCGRQDAITLRCEFRRAGIQRQSTGLPHLYGFESAALWIPEKRTPTGVLFLVRATGLEPARRSQRNLNPPSLPIPPRPRIADNRVILPWAQRLVNAADRDRLRNSLRKGQFSQFLLSLSLTFRQSACKIG